MTKDGARRTVTVSMPLRSLGNGGGGSRPLQDNWGGFWLVRRSTSVLRHDRLRPPPCRQYDRLSSRWRLRFLRRPVRCFCSHRSSPDVVFTCPAFSIAILTDVQAKPLQTALSFSWSLLPITPYNAVCTGIRFSGSCIALSEPLSMARWAQDLRQNRQDP